MIDWGGDEEEQLDNGEGKIIMDQGTLLDEVADSGQSAWSPSAAGGIVEQALPSSLLLSSTLTKNK